MSNKLIANQVVSKLLKLGCTNFAMAPGSRSTPLIFEIEKQKENININLELFYDERSLGFYALGYAKATHRPMPIIVTSGTALANLMPAVCEAHVSKTPMIILSADRPEEEHNCGANQTMDQRNFFGKFCDVFVDLDAGAVIPDAENRSGASVAHSQGPTGKNSNGRVVDSALSADPTACDLSAIRNDGVVHINCRFRKPLEPEALI